MAYFPSGQSSTQTPKLIKLLLSDSPISSSSLTDNQPQFPFPFPFPFSLPSLPQASFLPHPSLRLYLPKFTHVHVDGFLSMINICLSKTTPILIFGSCLSYISSRTFTLSHRNHLRQKQKRPLSSIFFPFPTV